MRKRIIATSLNKKRFLSGVFLTLLATVVNAQPFPYQQAGLPVSQRVDDLMKRMTLEEKIAQIRHLHSWDIFNEQTLAVASHRSDDSVSLSMAAALST